MRVFFILLTMAIVLIVGVFVLAYAFVNGDYCSAVGVGVMLALILIAIVRLGIG